MNRRETFEQAVSPHTRGLYAFIRHLNRGECDDIYQEAMLAAWQGFERIRDPEALRPWLYGIARRKAMDAYRRQYRRDAREESWPSDLSQDGFEGHSVLRLDLDQALSTLTPRDRALLYLMFNQGFTGLQVGEVLGIPEGTVKSRLYALKRRLRLMTGDREETA